MAWINPYNFVQDLGHVERDEPIWHDRFYPNTYSGLIGCNLETLTPLFIPQPSECVRDETEHQKLKWFKINGQYVIPSTSIKGMLRAVVEALSGSCYSVFDSERLEHRAPFGLKFRCGVVTKMPSGGKPGRTGTAGGRPNPGTGESQGRGGIGQQSQEPVYRQHESRTSNASQRHHRFRRSGVGPGTASRSGKNSKNHTQIRYPADERR